MKNVTISRILLVFAVLLASNSVLSATIQYDVVNRLTSVVYSPTQRIDYVYDAAGNLIEERINGAAGLSVTAQASPVAGGSVSILPAQSSFVAGDVVTVTATPIAGYTFTGWSGVSGCTNASACTFTVGSTNIAAIANFSVPSTLQPLRVTAMPAAGGTVTQPNPAGYAAGAALSFTATPASGYVIDYWFGAGCVNFSGDTCAFAMPAHSSDVFVRFKQVGSGYTLSYDFSPLLHGPMINPLRAGVLDISPSQDQVPAGTAVTIRIIPASGFRVNTVRFTVGGVASVLCPSIQNFIFLPGETGTCTFTMPADNVNLTASFDTDLDRYSLDASVIPSDGGYVGLMTTPDQNWESLYVTTVPLRMLVAGGVSTTLTARAAGARAFLRWQNGPCANSTNPVCTFTMPSTAIVSNALFGDAPDASCTYSVVSPPLAFPGTGGSRSILVNTQAGCAFNAAVSDNSYTGDITSLTSGNTITLTLPAFTPNYGRLGVLRIHTGKEVISLPFIQAGNSSSAQIAGPSVDFGAVGVADVGTVTRAVSFTNTTSSALNVNALITRGPFAIRSNNCNSPLAVSASCSAIIEFVPRKAEASTGELLIATNNLAFATPLTGIASPTRENVAAATAGATVLATTRLDPFTYPDAALIDGDRRKTPPNQSPWVSGDAVNPQYLEVRFAAIRTVEWLYLFGNYQSGSIDFGEPSTVSTESSPQLTGFAVQYWTGTAWTGVTELSRVDGSSVWRRVNFTPVTTDRVRVVLPTITYGRQMVASELEVWTVASDKTPNAYAFAPELGVSLSTAVQSGAITPTGINTATPLSVSGGSYSVGCNGVFTTAAGALQPGQSVCVRHTSAASGASTVTTTLTIGGVAGTFSSTTQTVAVPPSDVTPDPIASQTIIDVAATSTIYFAPFSVTGINAPATLTISGAAGLEVSVGCTAAFTTAPGPVTNGQSICVRHRSAGAALTSAASSLSVGAVTVTFTSRTAAAALLACSLDIDGANGVTPEVDAVIINRYLIGIRGDALVAGLPQPLGVRNTGALAQAFIGTGTQFDVVGRPVAAPTALIDGLILTRLMRLVPDATLLTGITVPAGSQFMSAAQIRANVNAKCGTLF